jgi:hypothetical protein
VLARGGIQASAFASVHSALHSTPFLVARDLALLLLAILWFGQAHWVYRDARRRIGDPWLVATATLLGLVPVVGAAIYVLFRPPETLADTRTRAAEVRALEAALAGRHELCPVCRFEVEPAYLVCPVCTTRLRHACATCDAAIDPLWQACPFCGTRAGSTAPALAPVGADLDAALTAELQQQAVQRPRRRGSATRPRAAS